MLINDSVYEVRVRVTDIYRIFCWLWVIVRSKKLRDGCIYWYATMQGAADSTVRRIRSVVVGRVREGRFGRMHRMYRYVCTEYCYLSVNVQLP